jgi:hypothetical protein
MLAAALALTAVSPAPREALAAGSGAFCGPGWQRTTAPAVHSRTMLRDLDGVADDLWAVGTTFGRRDPQEPVIERWDGSGWTVVPAPSSLSGAQLLGVHRVGAAEAWAVGSGFDGFVTRGLALRWDGSVWSQVTVPTPGPSDELASVDGSGPDDVWAVGGSGAASDSPLILHWNGDRWSKVPAPTTGNDSALLDVSVVSPTDAWAVGARPTSNGSGVPLVLHWNGTAWSAVTRPSDTSGAFLDDADTAPDDDLWAAGGAWTWPVDPANGLVAHRSTGTWTSTRSSRAQWYGVAALGDDDVWTVGDSVQHGWSSHWDGSSWSDLAVPPARGPKAFSEIAAIESVAPDTLWLVGTASIPTGQTVKSGATPLAMRLCPLDVTDAGMSKASSRVSQGSGTLWRFPSSNHGSHDVTEALGLGPSREPLFATGSRPPGATGTFRLDHAGTFPVVDGSTGHTAGLTVPTEALPKKADLGTSFTVYTSALAELPSYLGTDIRYRKPGSEFWYRLVSGTRNGATPFTPEGTGVYTIQARLRNRTTGLVSGWSPFATINVTPP